MLYFVKKNKVVYSNSFGVEDAFEIKEFVGNKNIKANIFRVQQNNSIMCGLPLHWIYWFYVCR